MATINKRTKLTKPMIEKLTQALEQGCSVKGACGLVGISHERVVTILNAGGKESDKLNAVFNNREILKSDFSKIKFSAQGSKINENKFDSLYDSRGFYKIKGVKYVEGENILKITVYDFAGNKSEKVFIFDVKLDMS